MSAHPPRRHARGWEAIAVAALLNAGLVLVLDRVHLSVYAPADVALPTDPAAGEPWPGPGSFAEVALVGASPPALSLDAILGVGDAMADGTGAVRPRSADLPGDRAADRGGGAEGGTAAWTERRDRADDAALRSRPWNSPDAYRAPREDGRRRAASVEAITRHAQRTYGDRAPRPLAAAGAEAASTGDATGTGRPGGAAPLGPTPDTTGGAPGATTPARAPGATQVAREAAFVDEGARSVDVQRKGRPADDRAVAGASNNRNADPFDLTPPRSGGAHDGEGVQGDAGAGQLADGWGRGTAASRAGTGEGGGPTFASRQDPYFVELFRRLDRTIEYPRELAVGLISGRVIAIITLRADGELTAVTVHASSGHRRFDDELTGALRGLRRLPAVPTALLDGKSELRVMIPYTFRAPMIR